MHRPPRRHQQDSSSAGAREAELSEKLLDLSAFVEVVTAYSLDRAVDADKLCKAEARARLEVAALQKQLEVGGEGRLGFDSRWWRRRWRRRSR